ncbi:hypothetical protein OS493_027044 [Desmophyllum pertusum]|uniref:Uncharacterized protein n=1 Tax=Desmophyllum pertusum TaxID=174260 RepID=A0A9X0CDM2_9CNID|nr:hypothetical protein OS493_027044 [Desmophyllum pertusum]
MGWDECEDIQTEVIVTRQQTNASKSSLKAKENTYKPRRIVRAVRQMRNASKSTRTCARWTSLAADIKCELTWCTGDLCNAAALPMVSAIILIACACLAFLY